MSERDPVRWRRFNAGRLTVYLPDNGRRRERRLRLVEAPSNRKEDDHA